jgi:hypothetical protein
MLSKAMNCSVFHLCYFGFNLTLLEWLLNCGVCFYVAVNF